MVVEGEQDDEMYLSRWTCGTKMHTRAWRSWR